MVPVPVVILSIVSLYCENDLFMLSFIVDGNFDGIILCVPTRSVVVCCRADSGDFKTKCGPKLQFDVREVRIEFRIPTSHFERILLKIFTRVSENVMVEVAIS